MSAVTTDRLVEILVQQGKISEKDRDRLLALQQKSGKSFTHILFEEKALDEDEIVRLIAEQTNLPILKLEAYEIDAKLGSLIPQKLAERFEAVPIARIGDVLTVATSKPLDLVALDDLRELTHCDIRLVLARPTEIQTALTTFYSGSTALHQVLKEVDSEAIEIVAPTEEKTQIQKAKEAGVDDAPVVRMVNLVVSEAVRLRASDIHLEPYHDHFRIRYRIDGVLKETLHQSLELYSPVIARIKILSTLDITEKRIPQDGRFKVKLKERKIDFRVSILPTFYGEKAVLRLLDRANVRSGLDELGFSEKPISLFKEAIKRPYGMILVTGPTGSGKSTTLYSVLNLMNTSDRNLMTIEDPIEYEIEGITQTQVHPEIELTFASGLRSLLRQSPDVVLVGEIRDSETADIAVKAALTGHLVLSTLHTNSAAGAVTRLIDMGVEPFLIASSIIVMAAQRLMRRICPHCRTATTVAPEILKRVPPALLKGWQGMAYQGKGCAQCQQTGYRGRLGAIEVLWVDPEIREAILGRSSTEKIERLAREKGMETLFENSLGLFKAGKTTLEEVLRVTAAGE